MTILNAGAPASLLEEQFCRCESAAGTAVVLLSLGAAVRGLRFPRRIQSYWLTRDLASLMPITKLRFMNSLNPFVPTVSLITVPARDHKEWFRKAVFGVLAAQLLLLLALLLANGRSEAASPEVALTSVSSASVNASVHATAPPPEAVRSKPVAVIPPEAVAPVPPAAARGPYVIKSGDTLSSIARSSGCSVKALKAVNALASERLMVGQKLKLPESRVQIASETRPL